MDASNWRRLLVGVLVVLMLIGVVGLDLGLSAREVHAQTGGGVHVVRAGDTCDSIAREYDTTCDAIVKLNNLFNRNVIYIGQSLKIPFQLNTTLPVAMKNGDGTTTWTGVQTIHTVKRGENLTMIAGRYGVTVKGIQNQNGIRDASKIYAGQRLVIPNGATYTKGSSGQASRPRAATTSTGKLYHKVQARETLWSISQKYNTTVEELRRLNYMPWWDSMIYTGQSLRVQ